MSGILVFLFILLSQQSQVLLSEDNTTQIPSPSKEPSSSQAPEAESQLRNTYANLRHHHKSRTWGPHFEDNPVVNVTVKDGESTYLNCLVGLLEDKMVSWVRRKSDQLDLLTLGNKNHSSDSRFQSAFKYPNNWRLAILNATRKDSGTYLCQISTHPPKVLEVQLTVEAPEVFILSPQGHSQPDVHYNEGSTLKLVCKVHDLKSKIINWYKNKDLLNQDISRGGISIKTDMSSEEAISVLQVALVTKKDSGTYLCSAPPQNASVTVHVHVNGENPAELYLNQAMVATSSWCWQYQLLLTIFLLWFANNSQRHHHSY